MCKVLVAASVIHLAGIARTPVPALETKLERKIRGGRRTAYRIVIFFALRVVYGCVFFFFFFVLSDVSCS